MIEFDRSLSSITALVNKCYAFLFPKLPGYPGFSFSRLMATLWRVKVFNKMQGQLFDSFKDLLNKERREQKKKEYVSAEYEEMMNCFVESKNSTILSKFIQAIADISINEITIHMLGSTKLRPDEPYLKLQDEIITRTE